LEHLSQVCRLEGNTLKFASLAERNRILAEAAFEELGAPSVVDPNALFNSAYSLWRYEIGDDDQASGRLLALASGDMDIFAAGANRIRTGARAFDILHLLEAALPYLKTLDVDSIVDMCVAKYEHTKDDMMSGAFHGVLETWLSTRPDTAIELHSRVLASLTEVTAPLLGNAIAALANTDFDLASNMAQDDARSGVDPRARVGTWTLGRLIAHEGAPPAAVSELNDVIIRLAGTETGDLHGQVLRVAVGAMHKTSAFDSVLQDLAENGDQVVLAAAASSLFLKAEALRDRGVTERWLRLLVGLSPEFPAAIRDFDYALSRALKDPANLELVLSILTQWVGHFGDKGAIASNTAELFDGTIRALFKRSEYRACLLTDWLLSEKPEHPGALAGILSGIGHELDAALEFEMDRIDQLTSSDLLFLARRLLGFVHDRAQVTSLSLSLLNSNDVEARIYPVVRALLVDEIGYDYPRRTVEALRENVATRIADRDKGFLLHLADAIDHVVQIQNALPFLNEFRPPAQLRRLFARARAKQMSTTFEEANKKSVFRQLMKEIPIKAGNGTFNYRDSNYGTSTKLSSISHSMELPRRESFDPIGNQIRLYGFRIAKRDKPCD
jgi:hypothetical protein